MKNKTITLLFVGIFVCALLFSPGCQHKPATIGSFDKIIVLADSLLWRQVEDDVRAALEVETMTPQPEAIFKISQRSPEDLGDLTRYTNLLLIGTLQSQGHTKELLDKLLNDESKKRVEMDSSFFFQKKNAWARDQMLAVLVAKDVPTLKKQIQTHKDLIFRVFDDNTQNIVSASLYYSFEQKDIEKKFLQEHGWTVRVQHDYIVAIDSSEARFVWLRRMGPQRWFSVYWEPVADPSILSKEWMLAKRDSLAKQFYEGDFVYQDDGLKVTEKDIDFNGRFAIQLDGIWQNKKLVVGGPFRSIGFYNKSDGRIYLIDCAVLAPGRKKWPFMRQLIAMANTFKTADEIKKKEK